MGRRPHFGWDKLKSGVVCTIIGSGENHGDLIRWYKNPPLYYKTDIQFFVHAGIR